MPVVTIQALPLSPEKVDTMLADTSKALAGALETVESNVWVNFSPMAAVREGAAVPGAPQYHPIVTVLANPRGEELVGRGMAAVAESVARSLAVPMERVWIHWIALEPNRVFADGVRK